MYNLTAPSKQSSSTRMHLFMATLFVHYLSVTCLHYLQVKKIAKPLYPPLLAVTVFSDSQMEI